MVSKVGTAMLASRSDAAEERKGKERIDAATFPMIIFSFFLPHLTNYILSLVRRTNSSRAHFFLSSKIPRNSRANIFT